jgi:hypothetical protein
MSTGQIKTVLPNQSIRGSDALEFAGSSAKMNASFPGGAVMNPLDVAAVEHDPRFPSGSWTGFYLQWWMPGRHDMAIDLTFAAGQLQATGSDRVGPFTFQGEYIPADGQCRWVKTYLGRHQVTYSGVNEGEGIWGTWEIRELAGLYRDQGVFHIWPHGMTPTDASRATVQAYLSQLRTRWLTRLFCLAVGGALIGAALYSIGSLLRSWTGISIP